MLLQHLMHTLWVVILTSWVALTEIDAALSILSPRIPIQISRRSCLVGPDTENVGTFREARGRSIGDELRLERIVTHDKCHRLFPCSMTCIVPALGLRLRGGSDEGDREQEDGVTEVDWRLFETGEGEEAVEDHGVQENPQDLHYKKIVIPPRQQHPDKPPEKLALATWDCLPPFASEEHITLRLGAGHGTIVQVTCCPFLFLLALSDQRSPAKLALPA